MKEGSPRSSSSDNERAPARWQLRRRTAKRRRGALARETEIALAKLNRTVDASARVSGALALQRDAVAGGNSSKRDVFQGKRKRYSL